jgi:hypothetical protein
MEISRFMDLDQLAERMGPDATREDAGIMCEFLIAGPYKTTEEMPNEEWVEMLGFVTEAKIMWAENKKYE